MSDAEKINRLTELLDDARERLIGYIGFTCECDSSHEAAETVCCLCQYQNFLEGKPEFQVRVECPEAVKEAWAILGDVPVTEDEKLDAPYLFFQAGSCKYDVWHWIEEYYDVSIAEDLMGYKKSEQE